MRTHLIKENRILQMAWLSLLTIVFASFTSCTNKQTEEKAEEEPVAKQNILFIAVDDLNDWIGPLKGHPQTKTPNIDKLASRAVLFTNAHTAAPACNPSRVALMTGQYPTSTGIYINPQPWRPVLPDVITLPEYLRDNGYTAIGAGKIYHGAYPDPQGWDDYFPSKEKTKPDDPTPENVPVNGIPKTSHFDWGPLPDEESQMGDAKVAEWIAGQLQSDHEKPFFLAAGIYRPHLPWYVPQKYFDNYPIEDIQLPAFLEEDLDDVPEAGIKMAKPDGDHAKVTKHDQWQKAVQGYLASIEFADAQVGKIIDALDKSKYKDNTIVVLWSDHGWHLGEKQHWRKFSLWERSTRIAFMVIAPNVTKPGKSMRPVNSVDIYPTLLDLTGLPKKEDLDGLSLRPLLESPDANWERPSITTHGRGNHAIRDDQWRYIRYEDGGEELYDLENDANEWKNLASDEAYAEVKSRLSKWLPKSEAPSAPLENSYK